MASKSQPLFAFFGTPKFAVDVLNALEQNGLLPALVITVPDRARGRGLEVTPSPAKQWALERGIDVMTPATLKDEPFIAELKNTEWDIFAVAAYAKLIPSAVLEIPRRGCLNVHPSLLPKFRGPSPALSAILEDERVTGVTVMRMNEKMDEGDIVAQARVELEEAAWPPKGSDFEELLATEGGNLLAEAMRPWVAGEIAPEPQEHSQATFSRKFSDEDARIDPKGSRKDFLKIRAFNKGPRAYFLDAKGKRVIVTDATYSDGIITLVNVIPEGKKEMPYEEYARGATH
jgi:methionyl-tRNA formyltransferase